MQQRVVLNLLLLVVGILPHTRSTLLLDTLYRGISLFSQFVNFNPDSGISPLYQFFAERISKPTSPPKGDPGDRDEGPEEQEEVGPWGTLFRTLGFNSRQMSAIAVDLLVFLAQTVSKAFVNNTGHRRGKQLHKPLLDMVLEQPKVSRLLSSMQDPKLMENVLLEVDGRFTEEDNDCVQLLICRLSPFVTGMQTSLAFFLKEEVLVRDNPLKGETGFNGTTHESYVSDLTTVWGRLTPMERLLFFMPTFQDFLQHGEPCRRRFYRCGPQQ